MKTYTTCNLVDALPNQVDLENDPRWMQMNSGVAALPVMLNLTDGSWITMVKAKAGTTMATHYHTKPLQIFTARGHWHYAEYDWEAKTGHFLFEAPGECHTPTFIEDTLLYSVVSGPIIYPGDPDVVTDVYMHLEAVKKHYRDIGLEDEAWREIVR